MAKQLWKSGFDMSGYQSPAIFESLDRWSPETAEELSDLLRALQRKKGFGLFFVQCSPALGERVIEAIRKRFPKKRLIQFELDRQTEILYGQLIESYQEELFDIACVTGVEQALYAYEDTKRVVGWSSGDIYNYSWKGLPPLLSHLNRQRETFEANLPIALIFFVPRFVINYFVQRAPDFFDWRSGLFKFVESSENSQKVSPDLTSKTYQEYLDLSPEQRMEKIAKLKDKIIQIDPLDCKQRSSLLREQGQLFEVGGDFSQSLDCYDRALIANTKDYIAWNSKGNLLAELERYKEAIESYDCALEIKPDSLFIWHNRGNSLHHLKKYEEAVKSYDLALKIKPDLFFSWDSRGNVLTNLERYEEAIESYDSALEIKPDLFFSWHNRGNALAKLERYEEAIKSYDSALEIKPDLFFSWHSRGNALAKLERYEEAIKSYDSALEIKPDLFFPWHSRGNALTNLEKYKEAIESYDSALEIKPDLFFSWHNRGNALANLERYEEAIESYNRALKIKPDLFFSWHGRGDALTKLERYEEAIKSYDRALKIQPDFHYAWDNRGDALRKLQHYEEAIESYDHALKIQPDFHYAWNGRGDALRKLQHYEEAIESYDRALKIQPDFFIAWNSRGDALENLERYEEAIESYDRALEIQPNFFIAWKNKGHILYKLGKHKDAYYCFARITEMQPSDSEAWNAQGYLTLAQYTYGLKPIFLKPLLIRQIQDCRHSQDITKIDLENCQEARELFNRALDIEPKNNLAQANWSFPAYHLQQYKAALQSCDKALELNSNNEDKFYEIVYINRGYILIKLHKFTLALQDFTTALIFAFVIDSKHLKCSEAWSEAWLGHGISLYHLGRYSEAIKSFTQALILKHPLAQTNIKFAQQRLWHCPKWRNNSMSKVNYATMTDAELKRYILAHRDDRNAFYAYMDRRYS